MSAMTLPERIRAWDDWVEDESNDQMNDARKPFDAGIMLAAARVIEVWESGDLAEAVRELAQTAEAVVEGFPFDEDEDDRDAEIQNEERQVQ